MPFSALLPVGVLALVLLWSQVLGLLHGVAHGPSGANGFAAHHAQRVHVAPVARESALAVDGWLTRMFSGHRTDDGVADCRLFDQSSHFDVMPGLPVLALPLVVQPFVFSVLPGLALARWHALFQARGPPSGP